MLGNWVNVRLAGVGALLLGTLWLLTRYSRRVSDPWLARVAGVAAVGIAVLVVYETLRGDFDG